MTRRFRVLLRGHNGLAKLDGRLKRLGFFTTRVVDGEHEEEARHRAIELLRSELRLNDTFLNLDLQADDHVALTVDEITEIAQSDGEQRTPPGVSFFLEASEHH